MVKGPTAHNPPHNEGSAAHELVDYARSQVAHAWRAARGQDAPCLPQDFAPGYTLRGTGRRGGQGVVYEAVEHSTQRRVAIKVLWEGPLATANARARFEQEVRILAQLQHPHIVAIHSRRTIEGRCYYVMDYIAGQQLDAYLANAELSVRSKIELFLKVCDAVNAAHLRGIVHRDLKPSNIRIDENGEPHVLDFGLAKLLGADDGHDGCRHMTATGQFLGSLPWAAPEQVMEQPDRIDLRTDIYALGLVLYHMLTGSFPYDIAGASREVMDNVLRKDAQSPRCVCRAVDDELSTIVLKCLRKEPERRYQIAGELSRDLRRYLNGEPIDAKRDSTPYVLGKMVRRHRGLTAALAAIVLLTLAYAASMSYLYRRAVSSEREAAAQAVDARHEYRLARDAVAFLVGEVTDKLRDAPGTGAIRQSILEGAFERLELLTVEHGDDPELRVDVAQAHDQLAEIALALENFEQARKHLDAAIEIRSRLQAAGGLDAESQADRSINLVHLGDLARGQGDLDSAESFYRQALQIDEDLVSRFPDNPRFRDNLAWSYERFGWLAVQRGDSQEAQAYHRKQLDTMEWLIAIEPDNPVRMLGLSAAHARLAELAAQGCDWEEAKAHIQDSVDAARWSLEAEPHNPHFEREFVFKLVQQYRYQRASNEEAGDAGVLLEAREHAESLLADEPRVVANRKALDPVCAWLASAAKTQDEFQDVEDCWRKVLASLSLWGDEATLRQEAPEDYVDTLWRFGRTLRAQGREDEARSVFERIWGIVEQLSENRAEVPWLLMYAAELRSGDILPEYRDPGRAVRLAERAVELAGENDSTCLCLLGNACMANGEYQRAAQCFEDALTYVPCEETQRRPRIEHRLRECLAVLSEQDALKVP